MNRRDDERRSLPDVEDLLERARPQPTGRGLPPERVAVIAKAMREAADSAAPRPKSRRRRAALATGGLVVVMLGSGAVAWAVTRHRPAANPLTVACHDEPRLDSSVIGVTADSTPPVELCRQAWSEGEWGGSAPPLIACTGLDGPAEVFPGTDNQLCEALGLSPLSEDAADDADVEVQFQDALSDRLAEAGCIDIKQLETIIADELSGAGLEDWTVSVRGEPSDELPCAIATIDPVADNVTIELLPDIWATPPPDQGEP